MNKLLKVLAASALVATALVGCGKKDDGGAAAETAKIAKAGLGVVSSYEDGQVNTTFVALGLDKDGKIAYIDLDVAQSTPGDEKAEYAQTKEERGSDYGMKDTSAQIGKIEGGAEWYEQAEAFEKYCTGKTPDEVAATEVAEGAAKEGTDLAAGCTIHVTDFLEAVKKANENAVEVNADSVKLGRTMTNDAESKQLDTTLILLALDADGKVISAKLDVAQINEKVTATKSERGSEYGMKDTSAQIGKIEGGAEWYEQAKAFEDYCKGKTIDEIKATEVVDGAAKEGTDLAAGCTIHITDFLTAVEKAK